MGWAKYAEDINELISERTALLSQTTVDAEIKIAIHFEIPRILIESDTILKAEKDYSDTKIVCRDCGKEFLFSAKSQKYFEKQGWSKPKRCKCCREHRNTVFLMHASH